MTGSVGFLASATVSSRFRALSDQGARRGRDVGASDFSA